MEKLISCFGLAALIGVAYLFSENRSAVNRRLVLTGVGLQLTLAILVLGIPALGFSGPLRALFDAANQFFTAILNYSDLGAAFLFGGLADSEKSGFIFAVRVIPTIIFFSSLMGVLYHLGLMQIIVDVMAKGMLKLLKTSGAESLAAAANIFVGQTEAPLAVKPYIAGMTRSELFCLMTGGMATIAGGVLAGVVGLLNGTIPDIAGHLVTASVMSAPAAIILAKIMVPETKSPKTLGSLPKDSQGAVYSNVIEAAALGAGDGLKLALNVSAMLLAFIALIACVNGALGIIGGWISFESWGSILYPDGTALADVKLTFQLLIGWVFAPFAFLMGVPWSEALYAGQLMGEKMVLNEFVAYVSLSNMGDVLSERSAVIMSYALCCFANFSSIAIQIGGIGSIAESRTKELAALGFRAMIGGTLAAMMTGTLAGLLI